MLTEEDPDTNGEHLQQYEGSGEKQEKQSSSNQAAAAKANKQGESLPPIGGNSNSKTGGSAAANQSQDGIKQGKTEQLKKKTKKGKGKMLIFNLQYTCYPIIKKIAKELGFRVRTDDI